MYVHCDAAAVELMTRQIQRWLRAAKQDLDPGIRFLHASYGIGALDLLRQLASDTDVVTTAHVDPRTLHAELSRVQDEAEGAIKRSRMA